MTDATPPSDATWRNRFILINLVRIGGTALTIFAIVIWQGNIVRQGGWPAVGFPLALFGLVVSFVGPRWLARKWRSRP